MEWITNIKELHKEFNTRKECLEYALNFIENWCKENGLTFKYDEKLGVAGDYHDKDYVARLIKIISPSNRCYFYQLVIPNATIYDYKEEKYKGLFGKEHTWKVPIPESKRVAHWARLDRM